MILDANWQFDAGAKVAMPNNTTGVITNVIDWTDSLWKDWINTPIPLWYIVVITDVPDTGTSCAVAFYQHTADTVDSGGQLLFTGPAVALADMSASPDNDGHVLIAIPLLTVMTAAQAMGRKRYVGGVLVASGDCSSGGVRAFLHQGVNPPVWVARPAITGASNVVMPT